MNGRRLPVWIEEAREKQMAENPPTSGDWFAVQQKYWDIWLDFTRQTVPGATPDRPSTADAWTDGTLKSWDTVSAMVPPGAQDVFAQLMSLSQQYFRMAEKFTAGSAREQNLFSDHWLSTIGKTFESRERQAAWDLPLDTWRRTMSSMLPFPGDFLQAVQSEDMAHVPQALRERIDRFLSIPAVGYSREAQEQYQRLMRSILDYAKVLRDYNLAFMQVGVRSTERFFEKLNEQSSPVDSLRKLYDMWVDACEEIYGQYVMSQEYAQRYGQLVNALVAVKHHGSMIVDEALEGMNMPTRREINTLHQRVHETRRANHSLRLEMELIKDRLDVYAPALGKQNPTDTSLF
jgi:polyhydroxyalkanoate synthase subunit PhaE